MDLIVRNGVDRSILLPERPLEPPAEKEPEITRDDRVEYIEDHVRDFIAFAETYVPDIVGEFWDQWPHQRDRWMKNGVVMGGGRAHGDAAVL